jgi:tyrosinase
LTGRGEAAYVRRRRRSPGGSLTLTSPPRPAPVAAQLKIRESVSRLTPEKLQAFRDALARMMAIRDNRGYQFYAGWHGVPFQLCHHHDPEFLPWHRGYLYHFELGLQEIDPNVTLPWWDWVDEPGLPAAYARQRVVRRKNVLFDSPIEPFGVRPRREWPTRTFREPGNPMNPAPLAPPLRPRYDWLMGTASFTEFNRRLTMVHDNIHVWVGGTMSDPDWAAYDPIFWAHHTQVDRLWRIWQHQNPGARLPQFVLDETMTYARAPSFLGRDLLDAKQLGYEYAGIAATVPGPG